MSRKRILGDFKPIFGRGLAVLLPSIVTLWLLWQVGVFLFNNVAEPINRGIRSGILAAAPLVWPNGDDGAPDWYVVRDADIAALPESVRRGAEPKDLAAAVRREQLRSAWNQHWYADLAGLLVAVLAIYLAGRIFGNYIGRKIYARLEQLIGKIPGFKQVYPHVKQVVDLMFGDNSAMKAFREVVLVEYPRKGLWTLGLISGEAFQELRDAAGAPVVTVFIPTSPTPMTGFVINARRDDVIFLKMTIDQALRFVITAGVLTPENVPEAGPRPVPVTLARTPAPSAPSGSPVAPPNARPARDVP